MGRPRRMGTMLVFALSLAALLTYLTYTVFLPNPLVAAVPGGAFFLVVWGFLVVVGLQAID